jgi:aminoacrylate hydrolase
MILVHDTRSQLREIRHPSLVLCGELNFRAPLPLSEEDCRQRAWCWVVFEDAGELIELEKPEEFFRIVSTFIAHQ